MADSSIYAASCNPTRRAKQTILPKPTTSAEESSRPRPRTARDREMMRRLNHSMIEKARRTKINEALATLKQLVPQDFGYPKKDEDDDEYVEGKGKAAKRKEEKEKEFKLEILVRTVGYMQFLTERVATLEAASAAGAKVCNCKRKLEDDGEQGMPAKVAKLDTDPVGLPSISSWLPETLMSSHLPSPPLSTHFSPVIPAQPPPFLSLSPDEESAASLLLQISTASSSVHSIQTPSSMFRMS